MSGATDSSPWRASSASWLFRPCFRRMLATSSRCTEIEMSVCGDIQIEGRTNPSDRAPDARARVLSYLCPPLERCPFMHAQIHRPSIKRTCAPKERRYS